jgi:hypothetical protein
LNYWETLCNIRKEEVPDRKGKQVMGNQHSKKKPTKERKSLRWIPLKMV